VFIEVAAESFEILFYQLCVLSCAVEVCCCCVLSFREGINVLLLLFEVVPHFFEYGLYVRHEEKKKKERIKDLHLISAVCLSSL